MESKIVFVGSRPSLVARFLKVFKKSIKDDWQLYLMLMVPLTFVVLFRYMAYPYLRIAFMDYRPARGIDGSEWVGFQIFRDALSNPQFRTALRNSIIFNFSDLMFGFPAPIMLALLFNEIRFRRYKKITQTIMYLPHFLSWTIIASIALSMFRDETGMVNIYLRDNLGVIDTGIPFLTENTHWAVTYIAVNIWATMGWGSIIFLAAMSSIDPGLYEAAVIDGANRFRRMWHITLPGIRATIVTLLIINLGRVMGSNFERLITMGNVMVRDVQYQLAIFIFEWGLANARFSLATAVGLFQSAISFVLVVVSDRIAKKLGGTGFF